MKVLRWQEASLESSKGFYRGSKSLLTVVRPHARKSMKIHENLQKSMKTYENHGKLLFMLGMLLITSARWVSVSLRFSGRLSTHSFAIPPSCGARLRSSNIAGQLAILGCRDWEEHPKFDKLQVCMEYDENPQMTRNQPGIEQKFLERHPQKSKPTSMQSLNLLFQGQQLHPQSALTSYHRSIEGWRGRRQRR